MKFYSFTILHLNANLNWNCLSELKCIRIKQTTAGFMSIPMPKPPTLSHVLKVVNWLLLSTLVQVQVQRRVAVINYTFKLFATLHFGKADVEFGSAATVAVVAVAVADILLAAAAVAVVSVVAVALAATTAAFKLMLISIIFYSFASN